MSFEEYLKAVIEYFEIGGVTWETSYMRMLKKHRPDLYDQIRGERGYDLTETATNFPAFIHHVFTSWGK